jgi:AraC-like DNA-binding protein
MQCANYDTDHALRISEFPESALLNFSVMNGIVVVRQTEFSDFEALRDAAQDGPSEIVQLEQGKMTGTLTHLSVGSVGISTGNFSRGIRGRGVLSERRWMFIFFAKPVQVQHLEAAPGDIFLLAPGHEHYSRYYSANNYTSVFVEPDELFAFMASQPGAQDAGAWHQPASLLTGASSAAAAAGVSTLLAAIRDTTLSDNAADFYKRNILELMTAPVLKGVRYRDPRFQLSKLQLLQEVDRYLVAAGNRPVHISELTEVFKVNRRRLHRVFNDAVGISPIAFLRRKRLCDVHAALLMGGPDVTVRDVAIEHGFLELGRFAGAYRRLFGELPSQTLRRRIRT